MNNPSSDRFIRSRLKTRHLVLLVELGHHGSILGASQAAGLTQPAASKLLRELEDTLGVPLFERLPRGVVPTSYGEIMIRRAGAALSEMEAAHQEVRQGASGLGGRVAVGAVLTPASRLVPDAIGLLKARHAQVQVALHVDTSKVLVEMLRGGEIDIAVGRLHDPALAGELDFEPVAEETHRLIARAGHPWANRHDLRLEELAGGQWIVPPSGLLRDRLAALFVTRGLRLPADIIETKALPAIPALLLASDRVVAMPEELVRLYLDAGKLAVLPFDLGLRLDCYGIVTRRHHQLSPAATAMVQALRESCPAQR
jgi:DNA-binding transcriptional LysR family regulator